MVKKLPTWFQLSSKVLVSSLLMVLGLITVNPFTVSADTVYIPTAITGDSRLGHFNNGTLTKMYQTNEGHSSVTKGTECYFYLTFSESFVMSSAELSIVINDSRSTTVHVYGSSSSSFSDNYEIGTGTRSSTGILTINTSTSTAYQYYVIGMNSNYKNAGANSVWSIDGSFSNNGGRAFRFSGTTASVTQYTLTTNVSPSGSGTVTGGGTYDDRTSVTLTATANSGYLFDHWENDSNVNLGTSNPFNYVISRDLTITAYFVEDTPTPITYTITTNVSPSGSGTVTGGGSYESGTVVSLSASANSGYSFSQWSDGVTSNPRSITVSGNATYTAQFTANTPSPTYYTYSVSSNNGNYGSVSPLGGSVQSGNSVTITATANTGYLFDRWISVGSGNTVSTSNPYTFTITGDVSYQAVFVVDPNYVPPSILLLVHKNIYNYNYPTDPVLINLYSPPGASVVNSSGTSVNKTFTAGTDFPAYVDYAVSYNYSTTLYSYKGIRDSSGNHFGNNVTVESGYMRDIIRVNYQAFYSRGSVNNGVYNSVTVYYPLPDSSNTYTLNSAYLAGSYTSGNITYYPDNVGSSTDQLIMNGDDNTTSTSGSLDSGTSNMSTEFNEYFTLEDDFLTDMTNSINDIEVSSDLVTDTNFLAAADWVRTQFNNLTLNTPFGLVVTFTLILGLALLIIGKIR